LNTLIASTALLVTILLTMILGILAGYAAVMGLLHAFGHHRAARPAPATLAHTGVSGD
jgi:hypothetical protein